MAKQIQITLSDEDFQEAKAQADLRHWEVEQWIEFSLRYAARCNPHSSERKKRKRMTPEEFRQFLKEARKHNNPNPDEVDRIMREQLLQEIRDSQ